MAFQQKLLGPRSITVSNKANNHEIARLERLNEELSNSLRRCRKMLHDYEVRLTANSNETVTDDQETKEA